MNRIKHLTFASFKKATQLISGTFPLEVFTYKKGTKAFEFHFRAEHNRYLDNSIFVVNTSKASFDGVEIRLTCSTYYQIDFFEGVVASWFPLDDGEHWRLNPTNVEPTIENAIAMLMETVS